MEKINELLNQVADECESKGIPFLACYGLDKISVIEYAPDTTPERIRKARTTLVTTVAQARRTMEILA